jgi:hypothetical protein
MKHVFVLLEAQLIGGCIYAMNRKLRYHLYEATSQTMGTHVVQWKIVLMEANSQLDRSRFNACTNNPNYLEAFAKIL